MKTTASIGKANPIQDTTVDARTGNETAPQGKPESELRAAARRRGLTLKQLAPLMGVSHGYLSQVSSGRRHWTRQLRGKAMEVLGEVPGEGSVYRQGGVVP